KKTKRAKGITLQEFIAEGKPINSSQVTKSVGSWADAVEEEECRPPQTFSLPTAPRASRVFDYVPENAPYTAYLTRLPFDANREDIEDFFSDLHITDIKLPREDDNSSKNRGFAYVEFAERGDLVAAISIPDPTLMNRRFKIDLPDEEQGKRGGGGGRDGREDNDGGGLGRRGGYGYSNRDRHRDPSPETGNWREKLRPRSDSPPPERYPK
ncbi:Eukaryotic translation initiation factor 4B, partial [Pseudolycoriella hygida]